MVIRQRFFNLAHCPVYSLPVYVSNIQTKVLVVVDYEFIGLAWYSVTEWCASCSTAGLHPEAYSELSQTAHAPDVGVIADSFIWEMKSVICQLQKCQFLDGCFYL